MGEWEREKESEVRSNRWKNCCPGDQRTMACSSEYDFAMCTCAYTLIATVFWWPNRKMRHCPPSPVHCRESSYRIDKSIGGEALNYQVWVCHSLLMSSILFEQRIRLCVESIQENVHECRAFLQWDQRMLIDFAASLSRGCRGRYRMAKSFDVDFNKKQI